MLRALQDRQLSGQVRFVCFDSNAGRRRVNAATSGAGGLLVRLFELAGDLLPQLQAICQIGLQSLQLRRQFGQQIQIAGFTGAADTLDEVFPGTLPYSAYPHSPCETGFDPTPVSLVNHSPMLIRNFNVIYE